MEGQSVQDYLDEEEVEEFKEDYEHENDIF